METRLTMWQEIAPILEAYAAGQMNLPHISPSPTGRPMEASHSPRLAAPITRASYICSLQDVSRALLHPTALAPSYN